MFKLIIFKMSESHQGPEICDIISAKGYLVTAVE